MARVYRIRDTQRFIFLALLFPLMPLSMQVIHPPWTKVLFVVELLFIVYTFWMLFRTRELEIGAQELRIDRGKWAQLISHEEIYELILIKGCKVGIRTEGRHRLLRIDTEDYEEAMQAFDRFAERHAIPLIDRRPQRRLKRS